MKNLSENYKKDINAVKGLSATYNAICEQMFRLSALYRNLHVNYDGNPYVENHFEEWYHECDSEAFDLQHRVKIVDYDAIINPFFAIAGCYAPLSYSNENVDHMQLKMTFNTSEAIRYMLQLEESFLLFCLDVDDLLISTVDPAGTDRLAGIIEKSEYRIMHMRNMLSA